MPVELFCPKCGAANVAAGTAARINFCSGCGAKFPAGKAAGPLRIFLSYGHDANEPLVQRIRIDLEQRRHTLWIDRSNIKEGDDWRAEITNGILRSDRVLSFLSQHSTREPGVCLDEIGIAIGYKGNNIQTILVESEKDVRPPASISHIQWLDMRDWKTGHGLVETVIERPNTAVARGDAAWEAWYQARLGAVVEVIESDVSRRLAGEIETLNNYLSPISSDTRIAALLRQGFVGREWLLKAVEAWRVKPGRTKRLYSITGDPGVGKSAFAANLTHFGRDKVVAAQFVEWDKPAYRDPARVIRSLAFQLATRLPDYRAFLLAQPDLTRLDHKTPAQLFTDLIAAPLELGIEGDRPRYLIIIDALDEAAESGHNTLLDLLAQHAEELPPWISLIVTSRPESNVVAALDDFDSLHLESLAKDNLDDLERYLRGELHAQLAGRTDPDRLIEQILRRSEGVFLYVRRFCEDVRRHPKLLDHPSRFPRGLGGIYLRWFKRQFPDLSAYREQYRPLLRTILAAPEPVPVTIVRDIFHLPDDRFADFTNTLGSLFQVVPEAGGDVIKPYHKSLADWLCDKSKAGVYYVSTFEGHQLLGAHGWDQFQRCQHDLVALPAYHWKQLAAHLTALNRGADCRAVQGAILAHLAAKIAPSIHEHFMMMAGRSRGDYRPVSFAELSEESRESALSSARRIPELLSPIQLKLVPGSSTRAEELPVVARMQAQLELLAEREHVGWMEFMFSRQWRRGEIRDRERRLHPQLRPYDELGEPEREKARQWVRDIPEYVRRAGFKIVFDDSPALDEQR